jgi:hypothetical protein
MTKTESIKSARHALRFARDRLREAGADKAADYVARALKSAEGAQRHADGQELREKYPPITRANGFV